MSTGEASSPLVSRERAVELLGTMQGGYNVAALVDALDDIVRVATRSFAA